MKQAAILAFLLIMGTVSLRAQNVVSGWVIGPDGDPVAGAQVKSSKSNESTTTDSEGKFSLETDYAVKRINVSSEGFKTIKKLPTEENMVIRMAETTWWNATPTKYQWLVGVDVVLPYTELKPALGLMVGRVKKFGWYAKFAYWPAKSDGDGYNYFYTGRNSTGYCSYFAGGMMRLGCPIYFYLGAGYAKWEVAWECVNGEYYVIDDGMNGLAVDAGLMLKMNKVFLHAGAQSCIEGLDDRIAVNIGFGLVL